MTERYMAAKTASDQTKAAVARKNERPLPTPEEVQQAGLALWGVFKATDAACMEGGKAVLERMLELGWRPAGEALSARVQELEAESEEIAQNAAEYEAQVPIAWQEARAEAFEEAARWLGEGPDMAGMVRLFRNLATEARQGATDAQEPGGHPDTGKPENATQQPTEGAGGAL